jgi:hypothetical protein
MSGSLNRSRQGPLQDELRTPFSLLHCSLTAVPTLCPQVTSLPRSPPRPCPCQPRTTTGSRRFCGNVGPVSARVRCREWPRAGGCGGRPPAGGSRPGSTPTRRSRPRCRAPCAPPLMLAVQVDERVPQDAKQPRLEVGAILELPERADGPGVRLLHQVLGLRAAAGQVARSCTAIDVSHRLADEARAGAGDLRRTHLAGILDPSRLAPLFNEGNAHPVPSPAPRAGRPPAGRA